MKILTNKQWKRLNNTLSEYMAKYLLAKEELRQRESYLDNEKKVAFELNEELLELRQKYEDLKEITKSLKKQNTTLKRKLTIATKEEE